MVGWVVEWVVSGWVGEIEIKAKLSPAEAGVWAELGNNFKVIKISLAYFIYSPWHSHGQQK